MTAYILGCYLCGGLWLHSVTIIYVASVSYASRACAAIPRLVTQNNPGLEVHSMPIVLLTLGVEKRHGPKIIEESHWVNCDARERSPKE